jgi:glycosyltransferase involved in cell wall biosynthesis
MPETVVVVPCFNEERRLDAAEVRRLAAAPGVRVLLVDDGSRDGTRAVLSKLAEGSGGRVGTLLLDQNMGKAEAVRRGLLEALAGGAAIVGYLDADFSTPADELLRMIDELASPGVDVVMGSRIARAGAAIRRKTTRHLTGRMFATAASLILGQPFYDTQCGAKLFRDTPALREALSAPLHSRWAFDVELLGRLLNASSPAPFTSFLEVPLRAWKDVGGSKLTGKAMAGASVDLLRIKWALKAWGK